MGKKLVSFASAVFMLVIFVPVLYDTIFVGNDVEYNGEHKIETTFSWFQESFFHAWDYEEITESRYKDANYIPVFAVMAVLGYSELSKAAHDCLCGILAKRVFKKYM